MNRPVDEGDRCQQDGCPGEYAYRPDGDCTCHIAPPCGVCVEAPLLCTVCGEEPTAPIYEHG